MGNGNWVRISHRRLDRRELAQLADLSVPQQITRMAVLARPKHQIPKGQVSAQGGFTLAELVDPAGHVLATGRAYCSAGDTYCKHTGRVKAVGRLTSKMISRGLTLGEAVG